MFYNRIKEYPIEYLLLAITICLQFYRLGIGEIQSWDEALYCVRADACLRFGAWLDQTQYAVGGLYSSTHPPLAIWGIALGKFIFGDATFAPRLFIALSSVLSLIYIYKLAKHLTSERTALLSTTLFGNAQLWLWYGHHAQLDVPMHTTILICSYYTIRSYDRELRSLVLPGLFFGFALLIKAFQPLYLLPFLLLVAYSYSKQKVLIKTLYTVAIGIAIAFPWYLMMILQYETYLGDWSSLFSSLGLGTYHETPGKWWYYTNQLIISYPFVFLILFLTVKITISIKNNVTIARDQKIFICSLAWLVFMLLLISGMKTNMPHFVLFLSLPTIFCSIYAIEQLSKEPNKGLTKVSLAFTSIAILWGMSEQLRMFIKGELHLTFEYNLVLLVVLSIIVLIMSVYVFKLGKGNTKIIIILLAALVFGNVYRWSIKSKRVFISGAKEAVSALSSLETILIIHSDAPHENLMPQFAYYSNGMNLGWHKDKQAKTMTLNTGLTDSLSSRSKNVDAVVIHKALDRYSQHDSTRIELLASMNLLLSKSFNSRLVTRQYDVYLRK